MPPLRLCTIATTGTFLGSSIAAALDGHHVEVSYWFDHRCSFFGVLKLANAVTIKNYSMNRLPTLSTILYKLDTAILVYLHALMSIPSMHMHDIIISTPVQHAPCMDHRYLSISCTLLHHLSGMTLLYWWDVSCIIYYIHHNIITMHAGSSGVSRGGCSGCSSTPLSSDKVQYSMC